ncbi:hypothetical protein GLAREA_04146 [Glarea lozoyensis ATCC 20868]|uniref:Uncharacterized protein n=1 Tax=Glarea lozoyensis (strain ATCC 20868 / MF5171) TaxID=1116229 RepID=S3D1Y8_GLAL2|nr:uncharacterized protein GLAREA_04146 [Glarea lozoyensis ATCC 20868]EPE31179.1 hypothetical protein GLAREA_04146 [Glarea lozoyensis ATCC 20868]
MITTSTLLSPFLSLLPSKDVQVSIDAVRENSDESLPLLNVTKSMTADPQSHTMGDKLIPYVAPKIHSCIQTNTFSSIFVIGEHLRSHPALITSNEKADKPFNWQRPTASIIKRPEGDVLQLNVLPGPAYVEHYAALLSTYFASKAFTGSSMPSVYYQLPSSDAAINLFAASNLRHLGPVDFAIIGYVDSLHNSTGPGEWDTATQTLDGEEPPLFAWKKRVLPDKSVVAFVGCTACYWGDIGGQLIRSLSELNGVREAIYVGKLGTLNERYLPNSVLATGSSSIFMDGGVVEWDSILKRAVQGSSIVKDGVHLTVPTTIYETKEWAREMKTKGDWVDPEIGNMARISKEKGVGFGFLHVVTDNLSREGLEGLVNERKSTIVAARKELLCEVEIVLERYFEEKMNIV